MESGRDPNKREMLLFQQEPADGHVVSSPFSRRRQVLATLCATLGCLVNGAVIGFTGPAIPSLADPSQVGNSVWGTNLEITDQGASWITSLLSVGCFVGCILAGPVMEKIGRKKSLMLVSTFNYFVGFLFIILANSQEMVCIGRFLNGLGLGFVLATVSVYIVEIASVDMRGLLGCFVQFQGSIGILLTFCLGVKLNWWQLAVAHLALIVVFFVSMWFVPESPRWLIMKGKEWQGEVSLKWLRGRGPALLDREIEQIKRDIAVKKRERISINLLLDREVIKPFLICLCMMFFLQMSGFNVMVFYFASIFKLSGSWVDPHIASIVGGGVLLVSCFVALGVVSRLNRKVMLITSITCMAACHFILGTYFFHLEASQKNANTSLSQPEPTCVDCSVQPETRRVLEPALDPTQLAAMAPVSWVPLITLLLFLFTGNVGYGTLIWVVTAEILPPKVRSVANSVIICFAFVTGFFVAKTFVDLIAGAGLAGTFWFYGSVCLLGAIFTLIFIPETRGKTIQQIQAHFQGRKTRGDHEAIPQTPS